MKTIQKRESTIFGNINLGTTKEPEFHSCTAMVRINTPEESDLAAWFGGDADDLPAEFTNHRANVVHLLAQQDLQHDGSGEVKKQCKNFLLKKITRETLDKFVYERDFSTAVGERSYTSSAESIIKKLVGKGLTDEQILELVKKAKSE
jgi:hypothetical protein